MGSLINKDSYTKAFGIALFEVESYSMYPDLDKGDLIIVKKRKPEKYQVDNFLIKSKIVCQETL